MRISKYTKTFTAIARVLSVIVLIDGVPAVSEGADAIPAPGSKLAPADAPKTISAADVTAERVGSSIPVSAIGEPVSAVTLSAPRWVDGANGGYGVVDGVI